MKIREFKKLIQSLPSEYDVLDLGAVNLCPDCTPDTMRAEVEPETGIVVIYNSQPCEEDDDEESDPEDEMLDALDDESGDGDEGPGNDC